MIRRLVPAILFTACLVVRPAAAQEKSAPGYDEALSALTVDSEVAPREAPLGAEVVFDARVEHGGDGSIGFAAPYTGGTLVVKSAGISTTDDGASLVRVVVTGLDLGSFELPPLKLRWTDGEGVDHPFDVLGGKVEIVSTGAEQAEPADFAPPVVISSLNPWFFGVVGGVLLLGIAAWLLLRRRRNRQPEVAPEPVDPRSPGQVALDEIFELQTGGLLEKGEIKAFTYALDDIVRRFVIRTVGRGELSETSDELLRAVEPALSVVHAAALREFFNRGDRVRFAGTEHAPEEARLLCESAIAFVTRMSGERNGRTDEVPR